MDGILICTVFSSLREGFKGILSAKVLEVIELIEELAPPKLAENWDRIGLQIGKKKDSVTGIVVSLDPGLGAIEFACEEQCNLLITHHPYFYRPLERIDLDTSSGKFLKLALANGINLFCAHTNLDSAKGGINDVLADLLHLENTRPLQVHKEEGTVGMGRMGSLPQKMTLLDFANQVKKVLETPTLRMVGNPEAEVQRIAVCGGSGSKLIPLALKEEVDCYVTADIRYHEALDALGEGFFLIDPGHFSMERVVIPSMVNYLKEGLEKKGLEVPVKGYLGESDPFQFI